MRPGRFAGAWLAAAMAVAVLLVGGSSWAISDVGAEEERQRPGAHAEHQQEDRTTAAPAAEQQKPPESTHYEARCDKPKDREDADLCEQRRMAKAAEDTVEVGRRQIFLGWFGLGGVLLTLIFTAIAAIAAALAARAAQASVAVASQTAELQLRAYVSCTQAKMMGVDADKVPRANLTFRNSGSTPAQNLTVTSNIHYREHPPNPGAAIIDMPGPPARMSLGPGSEVVIVARRRKDRVTKKEAPLQHREMYDMAGGRFALYIHIVATYTDIFDRKNTVEQRFMYTQTCIERGDFLAEICPYGNEHYYGREPDRAGPPAAPKWWQRARRAARRWARGRLARWRGSAHRPAP